MQATCSLLAALLLIMATLLEAAAYPWMSNEVGYDASLDPVIWSRAFTKDTIRKPRYMQAFAKLRNLVGDERDAEDLYRLMSRSKNVIPANQPYMERGFGKRGRKQTNAWQGGDVPNLTYQKQAQRKSFFRRRPRHKLNARERYGAYQP